MRFYVPEWDDHVDSEYDFVYDEHSSLDKSKRALAYIWDIFDRATTPIDGVLISREQVEDTPRKFNRLTSHGVHDAQPLNIPEWLPTISDCGAWGYKSLPFPPYENEGMLDFYEQLDVSIGVTVDHLVLGSGHTARLYLDKRAFSSDFTASDIPEMLEEEVDVMIDEWPDSWPEYVEADEPSICGTDPIQPFEPSTFEGTPEMILDRLADDPRAVYRDDDMTFRYDLTLRNAAEMQELYQAGDYSFRLMVAIQGWNPESYVEATEDVLEMGYQYLGIGGVAGSNQEVIERIVMAVGGAVKNYEREQTTRIETHVFGFAKTGAFETVGKSGITSFDSASMLRAAWTGGGNYHLDSNHRYDAIRVRYPAPGDTLETAIQKALRAQELLHALRAFDADESIAAALDGWQQSAERAFEHLEEYLRANRWDECFDESRLRDIEQAFRDDYEFGRELKASFSGVFRRRIIKLLREDDADDPIEFERYAYLIETAKEVFESRTTTCLSDIEALEDESGDVGTLEQLWMLIESYAEFIGDEGYLDAYEELLRVKPWQECLCPICTEYGIEVATFRGNNRNRRRGFHNTRRFYDEFEVELPKLLVITGASVQLSGADTIEAYLRRNQPMLWNAVHDLPVVEVGVVTANGVHEWWEDTPDRISFDRYAMAEELAEYCIRYQDVFIVKDNWNPSNAIVERIEDVGCAVNLHSSPTELRSAVLDRLGYEEEFVPRSSVQSGLMEF